MRHPYILRIGLCAGLVLCVAAQVASAQAGAAAQLKNPRFWTVDGQRMTAVFVESSGDNVVLRGRDGKLVSVSRYQLSREDAEFLEKAIGRTEPAPAKAGASSASATAAARSAPPPKPSVVEPAISRDDPFVGRFVKDTPPEEIRREEPPPTPKTRKLQSASPSSDIQLAGHPLTLGKKTEFFLPLTPEEMDTLRKEKLDKQQIRFGIWVPTDFDPTRPWRIFAVSRTTLKSNIEGISHYMAAARAMPGWIIVAGDGPEDPPVHDQTILRWVALRAGLNAMAREWGAKSWPIATGGFSGGGKMSGYLGALLMADGWNLIGMYMGGVNQDMASRGMDMYNPNRGQFKKTPIYIANGDKDGIAPVYKGERTQRRMKENGFRRVRMETYSGGHILNLKTVTDAMAWFEQLEKSGGDESAPQGASRPQPPARPERPERPAPPSRPQLHRPAYVPPSQR